MLSSLSFRSSENHRQAKQFKEVIYIALLERSGDLALSMEGTELSEQSEDGTSQSDKAQEDSNLDFKVNFPLLFTIE